MNLLLAAGVFVNTAVGDWVWARYGMAVADRRAAVASVFAILIILVGAAAVLAYTENHWMLIPAALGAGAGTYFTIRRHAR